METLNKAETHLYPPRKVGRGDGRHMTRTNKDDTEVWPGRVEWRCGRGQGGRATPDSLPQENRKGFFQLSLQQGEKAKVCSITSRRQDSNRQDRANQLLLCALRGQHRPAGQEEQTPQRSAAREEDWRAILRLLKAQVQASHIPKISNMVSSDSGTIVGKLSKRGKWERCQECKDRWVTLHFKERKV